MTLAEAKQLAADDLELSDEHVAQAQAEAAEAEQAAADLEASAVEGGKTAAAPSKVVEAKALADFARQRAGRIRERADRAAAARRLLQLEQVGKDVEALAASASRPGESIEAAVAKIAEGRAELLKLCAGHDAQVLALIARARQLDVEQPAPSGPRASSAHVAIVGNGITSTSGIQSGTATVRRTDEKTARAAAALAADGKPEQAIAQLQAARYVKPPERAPYYFLGTNGQVHGVDNPKIFAYQLSHGQARELTPDEVDAYLDGRFDGHQAAG